jgi:outer membrane protein assembly factor BamB
MLQVERSSTGEWSVNPLWDNRNMRTQFSNVVVAYNCAFGLDDKWLACIDLETGDKKWRGKGYKYGQVMRVDDLLVVQAEYGDVALVEANPEQFKELGRVPAFKDTTWNNPALSGPYLLVRNDREAVCYQLPLATEDK